jgi:hypothetical protein
MPVDPELAPHLHLLEGLTPADYQTAESRARIHALWTKFTAAGLPNMHITEQVGRLVPLGAAWWVKHLLLILKRLEVNHV